MAVVQDPPLARALFRMCEVGRPIPPEVYEAVARILAFVFGLKAKGVRPLAGTRLVAPGGDTRNLPTKRPKKTRRVAPRTALTA